MLVFGTAHRIARSNFVVTTRFHKVDEADDPFRLAFVFVGLFGQALAIGTRGEDIFITGTTCTVV